MPIKRLLLIRACGSDGEAEECDGIKSTATLLDIEVDDRTEIYPNDGDGVPEA